LWIEYLSEERQEFEIRQNFPKLSLEHKWDSLVRNARPASPEIQQRLEEAWKRELARQS
jgi:hypothetical protein